MPEQARDHLWICATHPAMRDNGDLDRMDPEARIKPTDQAEKDHSRHTSFMIFIAILALILADKRIEKPVTFYSG